MFTPPVGKCVNFGRCAKADSREAIPVTRGDANPVCPGCKEPILVSTPVGGPRIASLAVIGIVAVLLLAGLGFGLRRLLGGGSIQRVAIPTAVPASTVAAASGPTQTPSRQIVGRVGLRGTLSATPPPSRTITFPTVAPLAYAKLVRKAEKVDFTINFRPNSDVLDKTADLDVARLVPLMKSDRYRGRKLLVAGFADDSGDPEYSRILSARRAQSLAAELTSQGVAVAQTFGFGQAFPIGDNATREGRKKNRRVEIFIAH
jgi:outer membrane protein OmpA-like peptidoglycan-associated protein